MLVAARSGNIESDNRSTLHVPVNESFSRTDLVEHDQYYSPYHCVLRGIKEELGIPEEICKKHLYRSMTLPLYPMKERLA